MSECKFCSETDELERHHIVPKRHGGSDSDENIVSVCPTCHSKLERLYDSRFYDELGVSSTGRDEHDCSLPNCRAGSDVTIFGKYGEMHLCDAHNSCSKSDCDNRASWLASRGVYGKNVRYCSKHSNCDAIGCESSKVELCEDAGGGVGLYCESHADDLRNGVEVTPDAY